MDKLPHWPFQCFIKILFTFVAEVCVGEDPKILYINTERMCQNGRNSLCNRKANNPELQRERRTCKRTDAFGQKPPRYGENVQFKRKHGLVWTKPSDSQLVLLNYIKKETSNALGHLIVEWMEHTEVGGSYDTTVQQNSCAHDEIFKRNSNNGELMYAVFRTDTNSSRRGRRMLRRNTFQMRGITESTDPDSVTLPSVLFSLICCDGITRTFTSKQRSAECSTHPQVSSSPDKTTRLMSVSFHVSYSGLQWNLGQRGSKPHLSYLREFWNPVLAASHIAQYKQAQTL